MPAVQSGNFKLPAFKVKNHKLPSNIQRQLMGGPQKNIAGPAPIVTPIQFPGILNPDIYIQNTQSAPLFPQLNAPPVNLNLHINGLENYYRQKPLVIH